MQAKLLTIGTYFIELPFNALATAGAGLIPLFFGMKKIIWYRRSFTQLFCNS